MLPIQAVPDGGFPRLVDVRAVDGSFACRTETGSRFYQSYEAMTFDVLPKVRQELVNETLFVGSC